MLDKLKLLIEFTQQGTNMTYETIVLTSAGKKFWGTRKRSLILKVTDQPIELMGGYWDGGSRSSYFGKNKTGQAVGLSYPTDPPPFTKMPTPSVSPTDDLAIVKGGFFRGKECHLTVYVKSKEGWVF